MTIDVIFNFLKAGRVHKTFNSIAADYLTDDFIFDFLSSVPTVIFPRRFGLYWLHMFRLVHLSDLSDPIHKLTDILLAHMVKKRKVDITKFTVIIFYIVYMAHVLACIMVALGLQENCEEAEASSRGKHGVGLSQEAHLDGHCRKSWLFLDDNGFVGKPRIS